MKYYINKIEKSYVSSSVEIEDADYESIEQEEYDAFVNELKDERYKETLQLLEKEAKEKQAKREEIAKKLGLSKEDLEALF